MSTTPVQTAGTCPSCHTGTLVKNTMTKLACNSCGYEAIVDPKDSNAFVKPGVTLGQLFLLMLVIGVIFLVLFGDKVIAILEKLLN